MKINNIDSLQLVPVFMQDDNTVKGLCKAADYILSKLYERIFVIDLFNHIDLLDEADLDYIAIKLGISWYHDTFALYTKRDIIKHHKSMFYKLGTIGSIINVLNDVYGDGEVIEWYRYEGEPNHFKIQVSNDNSVYDNSRIFRSIINKIKRKSAVLDSIEVITSGTAHFSYMLVSSERERSMI